MRLLLDTHAALGWWADSPSLGAKARAAMIDPASEVHFSAACAYEIHLKARFGTLALRRALRGEGLTPAVLEEGWRSLPLLVPEASVVAALDHEHRDPFDRMLAAQPQLGPFTLAACDLLFRDLGIDLLGLSAMPLFERPPLNPLAPAKDRWTPLSLKRGRIGVPPPAWGWPGSITS